MKTINLKSYNIFDKNYEKYVLDFINNSSYFKKYGTFIHPISESNGECDAISEKYELDFKLFISQKEAKLRHEMADEIKENEDGTFKSLTHKNINQNENLSFYDLLKILPSYSLDDLEKINRNNFRFQDNEEEKEVSHFIKDILLKDKNLLFIIPKIFSIKNYSNKEFENLIKDLNDAYKTIFCFRENNIQKDSYLSFFVTDYNKDNESVKYIFNEHKKIENKIEEKFVLLECKNGNFKCLDVIPTSVSSFFHRFDDISMFSN